MTNSPAVARLLEEARSLDIVFTTREGRLFHTPKVIPPEFAARVREHKQEVIQAITGGGADAGLPPLIAAAQAAFTGVGGLTPDGITARDAIGRSDPASVAMPDGYSCRCCYRTCWWSLNPRATLLTCGYCHPPAKHLAVTWHTDDRGSGGTP